MFGKCGGLRYRDDPDEPNKFQDVREDNESAHSALHLTKCNTHESVVEISRPRGQFWVVAFEALTLLAELGVNLTALLSNAWGHKGTVAAIAGLVTWGLSTVLALIALTSRKGNKIVALDYEDDLEPSQEPLANLFSIATFGWVDAIVWQGYRKTFELSDVWNLAARDKAAAVLADFRQLKKTSKLAWHLLRYFKRDLLIQAAWAMTSGLFTFAPTLLLKAFLEYVENPQDTPVNAAWFYMILLAVSSCIKAITDGQALWKGRRICIRLRAIIVGEIYAKALRRKAAAGTDTILGGDKKKVDDKETPNGDSNKGNQQTTKQAKAENKESTDSQVNVGTIINLMAVDSFKVSEISAYLHFLWGSTPVQLVLCIVLLYRILGWSALASIVMMVLVMPLNLFLAKQFTQVQKKVMAATDVRIQSTNEVLQNIRIIKYFAWEQRFAQIISEKRAVELKALRNKYILWTFAATVWFSVPLLITFFSFLLYTVVEKRPLIPSVAFTALSLFGILRYPLDQLADMIAHVQESKVSVDRVEEFLNEEETEKYEQLSQDSKDEAGDPIIGFDNATLSWGTKHEQNAESKTAFQMIDIDLRFLVGRLNIIVGPTGSGKTSLLMALLGEMTLVRGSVYLPGGGSREELEKDSETGFTESIAYCAQQAWLANDTIRQNILFATFFDESRYKAVIAACALERDLEILDKGDATLVGEKGITLSGGQKQRISLARALYSYSRHVLLDDCLSAVDSHTAKHIFEQCICGPLMLGRTCILVTHNTALCVPNSHYVVSLTNGKVTAQGSPEEMMASGVLGDEFLKSRPGSKGGSQIQSRIQSIVHLDKVADQDANGHILETNGHSNGSSKEPASKNHESANIRTEEKATGSVNVKVIQMYLVSMGPWHYWVVGFFAFALQQVGSVAANVWLRIWANAYARSIQRIGLATSGPNESNTLYLRSFSFSSNSFSSGTPFWVLPLSSASPSSMNTLESSGEKVDAWHYLIIYALLAIFYVLVSFLREGYIFWGSLRASSRIHRSLLNSVTRAKLQFFDTTPLGQLMNRFSKDIEAIDQDVAPVAVGLIGCLFSMISIVILISVITPGFLIAGFFITIIYFAIGQFYVRSSRDLKRLESVQRSPLYQHFGETLSGIVTIRAYGDAPRFIRDNQNRVNTHNRPFIYLWAANRWLALRVDFTGALVAFFAGTFVILNMGSIDAGSAGLSLTYAVMFTENVLWLVRLYAMNEQNMNSAERVKEYIEVEQEAHAIIHEARPDGNWPSQGSIQFMNYTTRYRSDLEPVLKDLTFKIQPGERVGIVGRTGAGKSSLALALFRGLEAEAGKIVIDDVDIGLIGLQDLREAITIVPQDPTLFTGTVRSNLDPFSLFTDEEIFATLRRVQLIDVPSSNPGSSSATPIVPTILTPPDSPHSEDSNDLDLSKMKTNTRENANVFTNLSSPVAESGSNLSQGQRQLLCLARALLKAPRVLLMDEATASIDYVTDAKIQDTLREVKESTIITIAHRLQTIIDYDKVLVLDKGKLIEYDAPWELISKEGSIFRGMCEMSGDLEGLAEGAQKANKSISSLPSSDNGTIAIPTLQASIEPTASNLSTISQEASTVTSTVEARSAWTGSETTKRAEVTQDGAAELESDSPLDNTNFLSFEEWKSRNLAKAGQSAESLGLRGGNAGAEPRRRPGGISNALDSLGEDTEIEIDFGGFVNPGTSEPVISAKDSPESGNAASKDDSGEKKVLDDVSGARRRGKDAGKTCKERSNYASFDCAATVLKTNPECKGSTAVLVENKDSYLLNICSVKNKFFIVELCDDILIDTVVLANFEFFSSMFRTFRVSVSDRYPVKLEKWKELGTFEARNSREVQAFLIQNPLIWARYLRVEFLTHFGNEYYCPVSLLRVHGTTMMEEFNHDLKRSGTDDESENDVEDGEGAGSIDEVHGVVSAEVLVEQVRQTQSGEEASKRLHTAPTAAVVETPSKTPDAVSIPLPELDLGDTTYNTSLSKLMEDLLSSSNDSEDLCVPTDKPTIAAPIPTSPLPTNQTVSVTGKVIVSSGGIVNDTASQTISASYTSDTKSAEIPLLPSVSEKGVNQGKSETARTSNQTSTSIAKIQTSSTQPPNANPTTQESFFKSVHKRLQLLESNSTLSLQYIEEQSRILRDAFSKVEKRQLAKTTTFLETLNTTVLTELRDFRHQYDQIWQSTVLELSSQREQSQHEVFALSARLSLLADELLFQKRMAILQFVLILLCLGLALFSRHSSSATYLELPHVLQNSMQKSGASLSRYAPLFDTPPASPSSSRPTSRYGLLRSLTHRRNPSDESQLENTRDGTKSPSIEYSPPTPTSQTSPGSHPEGITEGESDNVSSDGYLGADPDSVRQTKSSPATPSGKREELRELGCSVSSPANEAGKM
ncbi:hypothetical protein P7C71_g5935, partial [Lecanoromycetidae sp. Uapishka_2]